MQMRDLKPANLIGLGWVRIEKSEKAAFAEHN